MAAAVPAIARAGGHEAGQLRLAPVAGATSVWAYEGGSDDERLAWGGSLEYYATRRAGVALDVLGSHQDNPYPQYYREYSSSELILGLTLRGYFLPDAPVTPYGIARITRTSRSTHVLTPWYESNTDDAWAGLDVGLGFQAPLARTGLELGVEASVGGLPLPLIALGGRTILLARLSVPLLATR